MHRRIIQFQWARLLALGSVHFMADLFSNVLPSILPAVRRHFGLSLFQGSALIVVLLLTSNLSQLAVGHVRARKSDPFFLYLGLVLAASISLLGLVPTGTRGFTSICGLAVVSGIGIAMIHPDALRGVHTIDRISPASTTAVFMAAGYLGYAFAGWISTLLVSRFELKGLLPLVFCPLISILAVRSLGIRLAVEQDTPAEETTGLGRPSLPFWMIVGLAIPTALSTTIVGSLLPTRLVDELGFKLTFGGISATAFGLGGAVGSVIWGAVAHRRGELRCTVIGLLLGVPFLVLYLFLMAHRMAILLLLGQGSSCFPHSS